MAKPRPRSRPTLDENVVAAHETIEDAAQKLGRAGDVLLRRIEDLSVEVQELRERTASEMRAAEARHAAETAAAQKAHEREVQGLRSERAKVEAELKGRVSTLELECRRLEEKLRKVQATLA